MFGINSHKAACNFIVQNSPQIVGLGWITKINVEVILLLDEKLNFVVNNMATQVSQAWVWVLVWLFSKWVLVPHLWMPVSLKLKMRVIVIIKIKRKHTQSISHGVWPIKVFNSWLIFTIFFTVKHHHNLSSRLCISKVLHLSQMFWGNAGFN